MDQAKPKAAPARPASPETAAGAYERVAAELDALPAERVGTINIDVSTAVATVVGASAKLAELRPDVVARLPNHPIEAIDKLTDYALAALYAHLQTFGRQLASPDRVHELLAEAAPLRQRLLAVADMLASLGMLEHDPVAAIRAGSGHLDTANDLIALSALFTNEWERLHNRVPLDPAELDRAARLGTELLVALGVRKVRSGDAPDVKGWADRKARAMRLMFDAYDSARQAVHYLRWKEDDAESYTPSLFSRRRRAPKPDETEPTPGGAEGNGH
jgi:hypothetical protein